MAENIRQQTSSVDQMLKVVEDQKQFSLAQVSQQLLFGIMIATKVEMKGFCNGCEGVDTFANRRQGDKANAMRVHSSDLSGDCQGEARLANPARSHQV